MRVRLALFAAFSALLLLTFLIDQWRRSRVESSQDLNILAASRRYRVDPALVKAVVWRESRFDPRARGSKGEVGLMQIMPDTAREWAGTERVSSFSEFTVADAARNIECGAWYLSKLLRRYQHTDNPVPYALADYNAGRSNVLKWMKGSAATNSLAFVQQIGFPGTRGYVQAVMKRRQRYQKTFPPVVSPSRTSGLALLYSARGGFWRRQSVACS